MNLIKLFLGLAYVSGIIVAIFLGILGFQDSNNHILPLIFSAFFILAFLWCSWGILRIKDTTECSFYIPLFLLLGGFILPIICNFSACNLLLDIPLAIILAGLLTLLFIKKVKLV
ncbi:MAG: hypothetical protein Q7S65_00050 [Nanoarchaeota archaeon]|nr:hypothetical protein [Nanoarchaeota archaeon]